MWPSLLLALYCFLIVGASLAGGWLPQVMRLTHTRMQLMMSGVAGLMLGVGMFHMLPHAAAELGSIDRAVAWSMTGLLTMFFLVRAFHSHEHGIVEEETSEGEQDCSHHDHAHHSHSGHGHHHGHAHAHVSEADQPLGWIGVAIGLSLHTALDGIALAAHVHADARHAASATLLGVSTFLAIMLHKPLDALSITALMRASNWPANFRQAINAGFALMCPLGAILFSFGLRQITAEQQLVIGSALAFSSGMFICIALGDLLPELQFHRHDRVKLSLALLAGVALAYVIGLVEGEHHHDHGPADVVSELVDVRGSEIPARGLNPGRSPGER